MAVMEALLKIRADVTGTGAVDKLGKSIGDATGKSKGLGDAFVRLGNAGRSLGGVFASIGVGAMAANFARAGIDSSRTEKRIANLAGQFGETEKLTDFAAEAAKRYGIGQTQAANGVADLYARLRPTGSSLDQIKTAFIGVNNAAGQMGLTADQTDNVMLQLSQALGSGKLQGDEFRSVMEQLPTIGQAVAKVLGTNVAGLKELSSSGAITSDVLLKALAELAKAEPPPPDAYKLYQSAVADLSTAIGEKLLPALTPLVQLATQAISVFSMLPEPVQTLVVAVGGLAAAFVFLAPAIAAISTAATAIGPLFAGISAAVGGIVAAMTGSGGLLAAIAAVFTGPVGWIALAVAAGVAIYAFRDQIAAAFKVIGDVLKAAAKFFYNSYVKPVITAGDLVVSGLKSAFSSLASILSSPFKTAVESIKNLFRSLLNFVASGINKATSGIRTLISNYNSIPLLPKVPNIPTVSVPAFAAGGVVSQPTLAMVGEAGREYIIPESKMAAAAANYLSGVRGDAVIPTFANGGTAGAAAGGGAANTTVQITTGPVLQQDGQRYVTIGDLERALQDYGAQIFRNSRSYGGRRYQGAY
jgi:tape measure domain-containing protein